MRGAKPRRMYPGKAAGHSATEGAWQGVAASAIAFDHDWPAPLTLNGEGFARIREAFAVAALRADRLGFDLVELQGAHGYLLHSFLSPAANRRDDRYGGSSENRMRFPLEVAAAARAVWPVDGGQNPHINGDKPKAGTEFAVAPPGQRGWTADRLSTPSAAEGGGRRPAFTGGQPSRHNRSPGVGARLPDGIPRRHRGLPVTKFRHLCAGFHRR